ncbi:hypothetical protein VTN31DRAFT_704 [Thermomyces dupontii]|uniref:uncharacterized protein n=1 Tax=Talaromyces thermophilus TaxID=28565 RepID=UPI00374363BB
MTDTDTGNSPDKRAVVSVNDGITGSIGVHQVNAHVDTEIKQKGGLSNVEKRDPITFYPYRPPKIGPNPQGGKRDAKPVDAFYPYYHPQKFGHPFKAPEAEVEKRDDPLVSLSHDASLEIGEDKGSILIEAEGDADVSLEADGIPLEDIIDIADDDPDALVALYGDHPEEEENGDDDP